MARLVEVGETEEGGSVYETVLDREGDINTLYKLMIALEEGGLIAPTGFSKKCNTEVDKREKSEDYEECN